MLLEELKRLEHRGDLESTVEADGEGETRTGQQPEEAGEEGK